MAKTTPDETILLIVGRELLAGLPSPARSPLLAAARFTIGRSWSRRSASVDCTIDSGEIVGLVGLRGAGQESVGRGVARSLAW